MSMSFTDTRMSQRLPIFLLAALLAACTSGPQQKASVDNVNTVRAIRQQAAAPAVAASDSIHQTTVTASAQAQAAAQQAVAEYFAAVQAMKAGKLNDALVGFQTIAAQQPVLSGPLVNQALIYIRQEKWDDALDTISQALKVNPRNPFAWNLRGIVLREQGKFKDARAAYEQALAIDPNYAKAHFNLGVLADLYLQDLPLALSHYERYQALQKKPDTAVTNWIGDLRNRLGLNQSKPAAPAGEAPAPAPATADKADNAS